ncbi:GTP-binding protein [Desulfosarcina sp. BuS5]|uniref:ribosome biogenesis GTP-binding protein YihA/YsxC n=1 Tax=Desulfosarcina sp. BuS5 TaxID=933262 RepID=UPI0004893A4A|nr:ribosome biogenesis GTP-binding protein YihA/YsxC [Desulfosarcina sp. BuS5]WDN89568.1 GTP-binding protein [Desulfosarcina sp. BuS5]
MIIKSSEFITSAVKPSQYPQTGLPEIAFAGRSNVGKSSLINRVINRKRLVKTSSTPGRTQLVNFFMVNSAFLFVDLPGYGYAKVPASVKKTWGPMIETYLSTRETLLGVVLLMDLRRIPGLEELNFINWLNHYDIPAILVLTKADKLSKTKQIKQILAISKTLSMDKGDLVLFSAKTNLGNERLRNEIENLLSPQLAIYSIDTS